MSITIASTHILKLGYKVQSDWSAHAELFGGFRTTKEEYDAALAAAATARENARAARERRTAELTRQKAIYAEVLAKTKHDLALARQALDEEVAAAAEAEKVAVSELGRLAKGARYYAKSLALSDDNTDNDFLGKTL